MLKEQMEAELERLEGLGIISPVQWGSPIVPVIKRDDSVRVCGDYKLTIK